MHGQGAGHRVARVAGLGDLRAGEGDLGVLLGVEEVFGTKVLVAILVLGVDAGGLDAENDGRRVEVRKVCRDGAVEIGELAAGFGNQVTDLEAHVGVGLVDGIIGGAGQSSCRDQDQRQ